MTSRGKLLLVYLFFCLANFLLCPLALAYEHSASALQHLNMAKEYVDQGKYDQAKLELEEGLKQDPKSPDILNNLGGVYMRISQSQHDSNKQSHTLSKAREYFTAALDENPDLSSAWNGLADVYYLSGQTRQATAYYKKALSLSPKNSYESQTNLANALRDTGSTDEARDNYQKAIVLNPLYAPAHNGYAELLFNNNDLAQARGEALEAIRLKPNYATAYYHLGLIETALGNKDVALKAYLLSLRYEKNSRYAQETQNLINKLGLDSNKISFQDLTRYQNELSQSLSSITTEENIKDKANPIATNINKNTKIIPSTINLPAENGQASIANIESSIANKDWSAATKAISTLLKSHPDDPVLLNELGMVLFSQKKYTSAEPVLKKAITKANGKLAAAYYNLAQVYLAKHDLSKAEANIKEAKVLASSEHKNCALIDNTRAIILKQKGDLSAAQSAYLEALNAADNNYPVIHYNLALLYEQMSKPKEARQEFNTYLQLSPHGLNAKNAQNHLKSTL